MYLDFSDVMENMVKVLMYAFIISFVIFTLYMNYNIGKAYCDFIGVPYNFCLSMISPGLALEVAILLSVLEFGILYYLFQKLKKIKIFNLLFEKINFLLKDDIYEWKY